MNISTLADKLYTAGIIKKKQKTTLETCMRGHQAENYRSVMENSGAAIEGWYKSLLEHGYSKKSGYSKGLVKAIKDGVRECVNYATANNNKTPPQQANTEMKNTIRKITQSIPDKGEKLEMNIKSTTLDVIKKCNEALEASLADTPSGKDSILRAQGMLKDIANQIDAVVDVSSKTAADKANKIFEEVQRAVNDYVVGNTSSTAAIEALERAKEVASSWTTVKISRWAKDARETDVKTSANINPVVLNKANVGSARNKIGDALNTLKARLSDTDSQKEKLDAMKNDRQALINERDEYNDKIETVKADWMAKTISSVDAQELILEYQQNLAGVEDRIDMYNSRISQFTEVRLANVGKLKELQIIIENASFFADSADVIVSIAKHIDFNAIHAFLSGSTNDIVIDKICEIDAVANIIAKRMKISAEEAKNKLRQTRGFVSMGQKTTVTLEDKMKKSHQQQLDADDFMNSLMNGGGKGTKVDAAPVTNTNAQTPIKISAGEEDI